MVVEIELDQFMEILWQGGVPAWNRWFYEHPGAWPENHCWDVGSPMPDGHVGICLKGADLSGMNLDGIILDGADLRHARCHRASLRGARLRMTEATGASFSGADLTGADLFLAIVHDADFHNTRLDDSNIFCLAIENQNTSFQNASVKARLHDLTRGLLLEFRNGRALHRDQPRDPRIN